MKQQEGLHRFLTAQEQDYAQALSEIRAGRKRSHWMWYIFPQLQGLGRSETAKYYAIQDLAEATAYLQHPVLGPRLLEISEALLALPGSDANVILGSPDDLKLRSSMTLFFQTANADPVFGELLQKFFSGRPDRATLALLGH